MRLLRSDGSVIVEVPTITWNEQQQGWDTGSTIYADPGRQYHVDGTPGVVAPTWETAPANYFWIDVGPFFDRFDRISPKKIAVLSSADLLVQALVKDSSVRQYIDLKRPDFQEAIGKIAAKGIITEAEMSAVLDQVTTDYERHVKGLPQPTE